MPNTMTQAADESQSTAGQTRLAAAGTTTLLMRDDRTMPTAFPQHQYTGPDSRLGVNTKDGNKPRYIAGSGCGLCSLVTYLHVANLLAPRYDKKIKRFWVDTTCRAIDPGSFNRYLLNRIESETNASTSREKLIRQVYAADGGGALRYDGKLVEWIEDLVHLHGIAIPQGFRFGEKIDCNAPPGRDIPTLTANIDQGEPSIIGVAFQPGSPPVHQVLVVGYARVGNKVYYPLVDSGVGAAPTANAKDLLMRANPMPIRSIKKYSATEERPIHHMVRIAWVRTLSGLAPFTRLRPRTNW